MGQIRRDSSISNWSIHIQHNAPYSLLSSGAKSQASQLRIMSAEGLAFRIQFQTKMNVVSYSDQELYKMV